MGSWGTDFSIQHAGCSLIPTYAFQDVAGHELVPEMKVILDVLIVKKDGWGITFWFASGNGYLGSHRPKEIIHSDADKVMLAASNEVSGITHG